MKCFELQVREELPYERQDLGKGVGTYNNLHRLSL